MTRRGVKQRGAISAGQLVSELLSKHGIGAKVREHRLVTEWESMVGPRVRRFGARAIRRAAAAG